MHWEPATEADWTSVVAMNAAEEAVLSPMSREGLARLVGWGGRLSVCRAEGEVAAFVLRFPDDSSYDSPNYRWFADRLRRFTYIDRLVIGGAWRGQGLGKRSYEHFVRDARARQCHWLCCEIDLEPANPPSLALNDRMGFVEVGRQRYGLKNKLVSLRVLSLDEGLG
ncbi:MAG: GNAT family N-acetyltransferase [Planctomycetaceae bacterium]|nr:GNAT family N-acetyltransferase [Planctomycetaceae bacterium]